MKSLGLQNRKRGSGSYRTDLDRGPELYQQ